MKAEDLDRLNLVSKELERKDNLRKLEGIGRQGVTTTGPIPGSRSDGGMANAVDMVRNALTDWHRIIDNYEKSAIELESKIAELEARLTGERDRCTRLERMMQEIVQLVTPQLKQS